MRKGEERPKEEALGDREFSYQDHYNALMSAGGVNHSYSASQGNQVVLSEAKEGLNLGDSHI